MEKPQEPHPGVLFDICPVSGAVSTGHSRRSSVIPEQIFRSFKERSRDSYQKIRASTVLSGPFQYAATPAAPLIHSITSISTSRGRPMSGSICEGPVVASGPGGRNAAMVALLTSRPNMGCIGVPSRDWGVDDLKSRARVLLDNIQISIVIRNQVPTERPTEQTLRIKNNKTGHCIYQVVTTPSGEELYAIDSLKDLFPNSKNLRNALISWNRHYKNPPQHWIVNFIPRAYLRRGYSLAEEIRDYLVQYQDGCKYRIEYEPIGHEPCLVGNVIPSTPKMRVRNPSRYWEGREKKDVRKMLIGG